MWLVYKVYWGSVGVCVEEFRSYCFGIFGCGVFVIKNRCSYWCVIGVMLDYICV